METIGIVEKPVMEMSKDELEVFATAKGIEIDKRRKLEDLQKQVLEATGLKKLPVTDQVAVTAAGPSKKTHLKHPISGMVFHWTQYLADRKDLIPCDVDGNE